MNSVKSSPMEKVAREVAARLRESGHIAYFAGGCVRDMVRGLIPKDYDIATDARPEAVQGLFPHTFAVGAHFGVIIVLENGFQFEIAPFVPMTNTSMEDIPARCIFPRLKKTRDVAISPSTECFMIRSQRS